MPRRSQKRKGEGGPEMGIRGPAEAPAPVQSGEGGQSPAPVASPTSAVSDGPAVWDVAVVGAGLGGLAVAALLARRGRAVVLVEQASEAGGLCRPLRREESAFDPGLELLLGFADGGPGRRLLARLGLEVPLGVADPGVQIALPRHRLSLPADPDGWWPEIRREFPGEEGGWHSLLDELASLAAEREAILRRLPPLPPTGWHARAHAWRVLTFGCERLRRMATTPFAATLQRHGLGADSRQALEALLAALDFRDAGQTSTLEAAAVFQWFRAGVACLPEGAPGLARALADSLEKSGGVLRLNTRADRCLVERGRIVGIETGTAATLRARDVVAAVPAPVLLALLPPARRWLGRRRPLEASAPTQVVEMMLGRVPEAYLPSELVAHCLTVLDADRPAGAGNLVRLQVAPGGEAAGETRQIALSGLCRPEEAPSPARLLATLEQVCPGAPGVLADSWHVSAAALAEHWGRPCGTPRFGVTSRAWLGRRGLPQQLPWRGLWAVGDATLSGGFLPDLLESALRLVDQLAGEES